jgi:hypothetical protein
MPVCSIEPQTVGTAVQRLPEHRGVPAGLSIALCAVTVAAPASRGGPTSPSPSRLSVSSCSLARSPGLPPSDTGGTLGPLPRFPAGGVVGAGGDCPDWPARPALLKPLGLREPPVREAAGDGGTRRPNQTPAPSPPPPSSPMAPSASPSPGGPPALSGAPRRLSVGVDGADAAALLGALLPPAYGGGAGALEGVVGVDRAKLLGLLREQARAAVAVQRCFRHALARHVVRLARRQHRASTTLCRVWRGCLGRRVRGEALGPRCRLCARARACA